MSLRVVPYTSDLKDIWNGFVASSKNGTFLFDRGYMEYHAARFVDASLLLYEDDSLVALFPASRKEDAVSSHGGLTYGGFVSGVDMTVARMLAVFDAAIAQLAHQGIRTLRYKTVPHIYHSIPAEEDRYALFRTNARLVRRDVLAVLAPGHAPEYQERRRRGVKKAMKSGMTVGESRDLAAFWRIVEGVLAQRHGAAPVHSAEEISMLAERFPASIRLFAATRDGAMLGGVLIYESSTVAHCQYIAANEDGRQLGALDLVFDTLISSVYRDKRHFDFGISNEDDGKVLNVGLMAQKEGFGARAVAHDFYEMTI